MLRKLVIVTFFAFFAVGCQTTRPLNNLHPDVWVNDDYSGSYKYSWIFMETCEQMGTIDKIAWIVDTKTACFVQEEGRTLMAAKTVIVLPNSERLFGYYEEVVPYAKDVPAIQNMESLIVRKSWMNALGKRRASF